MVSRKKQRKYYWEYGDDPRDAMPKENPRAFNKKKDTKKWCKGKPGREHKPVVELTSQYYMRTKCSATVKFVRWGPDGERVVRPAWFCIHHEVCSVCKKELKWRVGCPDNTENLPEYYS